MPGFFGLIGGIPGSGKSALGACIAFKVASDCAKWNREHPDEKPRAVVVYSLEDSKDVFIERQAFRMIDDSAGFTADDYREGKLTPEQYDLIADKVQRLYKYPILISDDPHTTLADIDEQIRAAAHEYEIRFVVLDFLQRLKEVQQGDRFQVLADLAQGFQDLAKVHHVPVWVMSQLKKPGASTGDKRGPGDRPIADDIYGGQQIVAAARFVYLLYREDQFLMQQPGYVPTGKAEIIVAKNNNGPVGIHHMWFDAVRTSFLNNKPGG